jgi:hypothetical protein
MIVSILISLLRRFLDERQLLESRAFEIYLAHLPGFAEGYREIAKTSYDAAIAFEEESKSRTIGIEDLKNLGSTVQGKNQP